MEIDIRNLIENEGVETVMQLIISPNKDYAAGIEALSRGVDPETGQKISPVHLIEMAQRENLEFELEQLMFNKALETFKPIYDGSPDLLLFINVGIAFIEKSIHHSLIEEGIAKYGIPANNIFFDLIAFDFEQLPVVKQFVEIYRKKGFYISVDDLGNDYSNIDKVLYLGPDLLKININPLRKLENKEYTQRMIQTLRMIAESMGIILVAKGIEDESDVSFSFECGMQFMQGYYISKPLDLTVDALFAIKERYRNLMAERVAAEESTQELTRTMTTKAYGIIKKIKNRLFIDPDQPLLIDCDWIFEHYPMVENLWVLDAKGKQFGGSTINEKEYQIKNASMFQVNNHGSDFSGKEIFLQLYDTILDVWVTTPFKSTLTNNLCITCSTRLDHSSEQAVLCLNINLDRISEEVKVRDSGEDEPFHIFIGE